MLPERTQFLLAPSEFQSLTLCFTTVASAHKTPNRDPIWVMKNSRTWMTFILSWLCHMTPGNLWRYTETRLLKNVLPRTFADSGCSTVYRSSNIYERRSVKTKTYRWSQWLWVLGRKSSQIDRWQQFEANVSIRVRIQWTRWLNSREVQFVEFLKWKVLFRFESFWVTFR